MNKIKIYITSVLFVFVSALTPANSFELPTIEADGLAIGVTVT